MVPFFNSTAVDVRHLPQKSGESLSELASGFFVHLYGFGRLEPDLFILVLAHQLVDLADAVDRLKREPDAARLIGNLAELNIELEELKESVEDRDDQRGI